VFSAAVPGSGYLAAVTRFLFLSDEWLEETRRIRAEYAGAIPEVPLSVRMNQVVQEVPFGSGVIHAHVDTSSGRPMLEIGHLEQPDVTVTLSYETARALIVDGDAQTAMAAFLSGKIRIDGDITKMMALQSAGSVNPSDPAAAELVQRIRAVTS